MRMNLGIGHEAETRKQAEYWAGALAFALLAAGSFGTAQAQDMAFDLDEAESAPAEEPAAEGAPAEGEGEAGAWLWRPARPSSCQPA